MMARADTVSLLLGGMLAVAMTASPVGAEPGSLPRWPALVNGAFGYVDEAGQVVIEPRFEQARNFVEGLACVQDHGKWGYIDVGGRFVIPPQFEWAYDFFHGAAWVGRGMADALLINREGRMMTAQAPEAESTPKHPGLLGSGRVHSALLPPPPTAFSHLR